MFINKRVMAGKLHEDAVQHAPASNGNIRFSFSIRQSRPIKLASGKTGIATEYARCTLWVSGSNHAFHADKLKSGAWVIVEGRHNVTKKQKGEEVVTYHDIDVAEIQYSPRGKVPPYINRHTVVGNLGRDAKFFPSNTTDRVKIVFSTASTRYRRNSDGQSSEETTWLDHVLWVVASVEDRYRKMLTQGAMVWIEGRHDVTKREVGGETKYYPEILVREVKLFTLEDQASAGDHPRHGSAPAPADEKPRAEDEFKSAFQPANFG